MAIMVDGHHEALTATVGSDQFAGVTAGHWDVELELPESAGPGDTIILEETHGREPTGRKVEATLIDVQPGSRAGYRRIRFEPKQSKYTPSR